MIAIDKLMKSYGRHVALAPLTLEIKAGEIFAFLGHNGAGKTTTIHMLTTLLKPSSGTARIAGHDICSAPHSVRQAIGYVPENVRLYDTMTARENLTFFARLSGVDKPQNRIEETLELLECSDLIDRRVGDFSKGLRQRIGLAQAILHRPAVLFLDEPSSGLDPRGIKTLRDLILQLNTVLSMTIFMNTHLISEVIKVATSIGILSQGQLVFHDTIDAVSKIYGDETSLEALYLSVTPVAPSARIV